MARNLDSEAAMIINDLNNLAIRIEMLQAHPQYTHAYNHVKNAVQAVRNGRSQIHVAAMTERFSIKTEPRMEVMDG